MQEKFEVSALERIYHHLLNGKMTLEEVNESAAISSLQELLANYKTQVASQSRTANLWLKYLEYICIIKMFIRVERIGHWNEHLGVMSRMLNLFAAIDHINYSRSTRLYLQSMQPLKVKPPWMYEQY